MNYLFPLGFYLMMGFIMAEINPPFRDSIIPAMIVFGVLAATLLGIPDPLVNARENSVFRSCKINGIPSTSILIIPALITTMHMAIVAVITTTTGQFLFDAPLPVNWLNFIVIFFALAIACTRLSILIGVISPNSRMTVLWSQVIFVPSMLLGGLMIPYSMLPEVAGNFSQILPAAHAMNAYNGLAMGGTAPFSPWGSVIMLTASGMIAFWLSTFLFSWDSRNTTRRGHPLLALLVLLPYVIGIFLQ